MNILVTGASGFVGAALTQALCRQHTVYGCSRRAEAEMQRGVHKIVLDYGNVAQGCFPLIDTVVHLAARVHVMREDAADPLALFRAANVSPTISLARLAASQGAKRFVFVSSIKVNGEMTLPGQAFFEDALPAPEDHYAISKWEAEQSLLQIAQDSGMEIVIIRPPLVYGPGVKGNFASMARWLQSGIPLPFGAIDNKRSLVALDNLVDFIGFCADPVKSPCAANETFLISDGEDVSTTELLKKIAKANLVNARLIPLPGGLLRLLLTLSGKADLSSRLLGSLIVDSSKARDMLGWRPVVSMDEQLRKMARYDASTI